MIRVPIRTKLAAALAVPLVGLCAITAIEVADTSADVERVHRQTELARASIGPTGILTLLQNERTWTVVELIGAESLIQSPVRRLRGGPAADRPGHRRVPGHDQPGQRRGGAGVPARARQPRRAGGRPQLGRRQHRPPRPRQVPFANDIFSAYSDLTEPFFEATDRVAIAVDDAELRQWTTLVGRSAEQVEVLANLSRQVVLDSSLGDGINQPAEIAATSQLKDDFDQANEEFLTAPPPFAEVVAASFDHDLVDGFSANVETALTGARIDFEPMLASLNVPAEEGYMGLRDALAVGLNERADELNADATARERLYVGLAVVTLGAALALTWLVSRSITRPLRSLTRQATDMAERRLPDAVSQILDTPPGEDVSVPQVAPVAVQTRDEVADVAAALNTVQDTALDLAIEQAVLRRNIADSFVNLGRRNQNLLGRQLDFITELESNETDPETLSDLFRLDHLATRMRRNAESLLVLAGFDPPRKWAAPVRLSDVIRAALGEVEDYHRVNVRDIEPATIMGSAAADLAHLLAELVENALVFSPPDQNVDIRGRQHRHDGPSVGSYTLAVIDAGLGMPDADLEAANRRLAGTESFTISPSKYLGHYVAGNLAARHGIRVGLDHSPGNGITATITLPPELLTTDPVTSAPVTPPHGQRAVRLSPGIPVPTPGARPRRPAPAVAAASAWPAAAGTAGRARSQPIWPRTLPPMPMRGTEAAPARSAAPPPAGPEPPVDRPPVRPPLSPLEAEASLLASLPRYAPPSRGGGPGPMPPPVGDGPAHHRRAPRRGPAPAAGGPAPDPARGGGPDAAHGRRPAPRRRAGRSPGPPAGRRVHGRHRRAGPADHVHRRGPARPGGEPAAQGGGRERRQRPQRRPVAAAVSRAPPAGARSSPARRSAAPRGCCRCRGRRRRAAGRPATSAPR